LANRFLSIDDLINMPAPRWAIRGLFEINSLVMLAGPPASFKSFLVIDWVLSMATGKKWHGRETSPGKVLYLLGEGKASLLKRIESWVHYYRLTASERQTLNDNFRVTFDVPQLASKASVDNMLAGLAAEDFAPNVIVVDTFARSFVGLDENSQKDTGLWIEQADRLRQAGYTVILIHHTAKNTEFGLKYRGSSAIMGALDTAFTLCRDQGSKVRATLSCAKQKDHPETEDLFFQRVNVQPDRLKGDDENSMVLIPTIKIDERYTPEGQAKEAREAELLEEVLGDETIEGPRAKARTLAKLAKITEGQAYGRISRRLGID
jgi:hypothetical protein